MFNLKGLLQDEEFLIAAGLLQQGSQGKGIGEAFFPAIAQAGQVKKAFGDTAKSTKPVWSIKDNANVLASDKVIAENPDNYLPAKTTKDQRIVKGADGFNYYVGGENDGDRVLPNVKKDKKEKKFTMGDAEVAVYNKLKVAKNNTEFKQILNSLSKPEQQLYYNKIAGNTDLLEQALAEQIENMVTLDVTQLGIVSEYKLTKKVEGFESVASVVEAQMANIRDASFEQVLDSLIKAGLIEK